MALSADGRVAYVTNYGVDSFTEAGPGETTITVVDVARREKRGEIDLGDSRRPHGIEVGASGRLYVTADQPPRLLVVDPERRRVLRRFELGQSLPHMLAVSRDERKAYTANSGSGTVSVLALDGEGHAPVRHLEVGGIPQGFAWSEDGKRLYATNRSGNTLLVIDPARDEVTARLTIPGQPARLRTVPGGPYLLVALLEAGDVAVVDTRSLQVAHRVHACARVEAVTSDAAGRFGYVACQAEGMVLRFTIPEARPVLEIKTGGKPDPLALLPPP
jgi:YVTN family beta-propeller protein